MNRTLRKNDVVSFCYKNNCIEVNGVNGKILAIGFLALLVFVGLTNDCN